jgi:hypothetical protein
VTPSAVVDIVEIMVDITIECFGSLHKDAGKHCVRQNTIGLEAIGILY